MEKDNLSGIMPFIKYLLVENNTPTGFGMPLSSYLEIKEKIEKDEIELIVTQDGETICLIYKNNTSQTNED